MNKPKDLPNEKRDGKTQRVFRRLAFSVECFNQIKSKQRELEAVRGSPITLATVIATICNEHKEMVTSEERQPELISRP